jgi:glycosyltransferase involved in cell wall biosynthesis
VTRILHVSHNHPGHRIGGGEVYAHELYRALSERGEFATTFVSKAGPPFSAEHVHDGTRFGLISGDEYFFYTHHREFDQLIGTARHKQLYTEDWRAFLQALQPDLVHFQHSVFLGYDMIRETRRTLPDAPIVYTFHEFKAMCHHNGQMVRTETNELCYESSPRRCNQCFPQISAETFFLRDRFIRSALDLVDAFLVPSAHAHQRYVEWGLPPEKLHHEPHGRIPVPAIPDPPDAGRRHRIAYIGQITPFKGVDLLLEAMKILGEQESPARLALYGGNLQHQSKPFQERIQQLLEETASNVSFPGPYTQEDLPQILSGVDWVVVPSLWWETGPLVISEALMHNRPVICSDIGAMVERIQHEVNGLHFRVGDPYSLADTIQRGVSSPELWDRLRAGISPPPAMDEHVERISRIYRELLEGRTTAAEEGPLTASAGR